LLARSVALIRRELPDCHVRFVGGDAPWSSAKMGSDVIRECAEGVSPGAYTVEPALPHERLLDLIGTATLVVLPSRFETFGMTLLEAMACGTAAVASDINAFREISDGGRYARLHVAEDFPDLALQVVTLLSDRDQRERLQTEAHAHSGRWDVSHIADHLLRVWN